MKNITKYVDNKKGFTLVEIIIALLIIFILVIAFVPMYEYIAQAMNSNKYKQVATGLANSVIEEMRALPYIVKDTDTGQVVTDPDVPQLGIQGGNPPGSIPATQTREVDGKTYTIKTRVYWVAKDDDPAAYKKVKVTVQCPSAFKGDVTVSSDFFTLASQEGEAEVFESGHVLVHIRDNDGNDWSSPEIQIKLASGSMEEIGYTEYGQALFGIIPAGTYTVSAQLPSNLVTRPDITLSSGWIEQSDITVTNLTTTDVYFDIDYPAKFSLTMSDKVTGDIIKGTGILGLNWNDISISSDSFDEDNFSGNKLASGNLWPGGEYTVSLYDVMDNSTYKAYYPYNMADSTADSKPQLNGSAWDGTLGDPGTVIDLTLAMQSALKVHLIADTSMIETDEEGTLSWMDQSGNGYNAVQDLGTNLSSFYNSSSNPAIEFTGAETLQIDYPVCYDNFTILAKVKPSAEHEIDVQATSGYGGVYNQLYLLWPNHGGDTNAGEGISLGTNGISNYEHGSDYMPATAVYYGSVSADDFSVIGIRYEDLQPSVYLNGYWVTTGEYSARSHVYSPTVIGGGPYGYYYGSLTEILIYDYLLSDDNIRLVSDYLAEQ